MPKHDPILESYEHDLALFTSLFCALTTTILWQYRYQHDNGDWQNILSILLNVDTSVFYSVTGTISFDAIRCIIHSKSTRMNSQHTRTCYQQIVPDGRTGARLLQQWATTPRFVAVMVQNSRLMCKFLIVPSTRMCKTFSTLLIVFVGIQMI